MQSIQVLSIADKNILSSLSFYFYLATSRAARFWPLSPPR